MKYKTQVWRPFQKDSYRWAWNEKKIVGVLQEFGRDIRRCHERIWRGYCDYDIFSIFDWFLGLMPTMLEDFKDHLHGCPAASEMHAHSVAPGSGDCVSEDMRAWIEVLERMNFLLRESDEEACSRKNPYQAEYDKAQAEFDEKYGPWGEKLMTDKEREDDRCGRGKRVYTLGHVPEFQEIDRKYMDEEKAIYQYRCACKDEALALFSKWFYDLWD